MIILMCPDCDSTEIGFNPEESNDNTDTFICGNCGNVFTKEEAGWTE